MTYTENNIINTELHLLFQCVYLEDGIHPEYEFVGAHINELDAKKHFESINGAIYKPFNKIIKHKINYDSETKPLFWNSKYDAWTDNGCFMSVDMSAILKCLNEN